MKKRIISAVTAIVMGTTAAAPAFASEAEPVREIFCGEYVEDEPGRDRLLIFDLDSEGAREANEMMISMADKTNYMASDNFSSCCGTLLSIVHVTHGLSDMSDYVTGTIDLATGDRLDNHELIAMTGLSEEEFIEWLRPLMAEKFKTEAELVRYKYDDYLRCFFHTITNEFCRIDIPMYVTDKGTLAAVPQIRLLYGSGIGRRVIDTGLSVVGAQEVLK